MQEPNLQHMIAKRLRTPGETASQTNLSVCLITALTVADFIDPELITEAHTKTGAQLGLLTLAALLREQGFWPHIVNLDDLFFDLIRRDEFRPPSALDEQARPRTASLAGRPDPLPESSQSFFQFVVEQLKSASFDVFGLSSICSS